MTINKDKSMRDLLQKLDLEKRSWIIVNHWDGDLSAIGIAHQDQPRRLIYISTLNPTPGGYYFECEEPAGPELSDYVVTKEGENVSYDELIQIMEHHLEIK